MILEQKHLKNINSIIPVISFIDSKNEIICNIPSNKLLVVLNVLKKHIGFQYNLLTCISGVHVLKVEYCFVVVYDLLSLLFNSRIRIKIFLSDAAVAYSIVPIYKNANWWEREVWDLFGVYFLGHPDLRRILTDYGFDGHPMMKNFPLSGFIEVKYDSIEKNILREPLELDQEYRHFKYENSWA